MKEFAIKLSILLASVLIGLVMCEAVVRIAAPQRLAFDRPLYEPDADLVFKLRKNFYAQHAQFEFDVVDKTNRFGLRDREIGEKNPGSYRILALGDSYGYGHGVALEETYAKRLETALNASMDRPVEVINAGVPSYSLLQEIRYLKKYGMALKPDAVLVGFYIGNDFVDSYELYDAAGNPTLEVHDGRLVSRKAHDGNQGIRELARPVRVQLATHSHLYTFLRNRFSEVLFLLGMRHIPPPPEFCETEMSPQMERQWAFTQDLFRELAAFTRDQGIDLAVLFIPTIYQVDQQQWNEYIKWYEIDASRYDLSQPQRLLADFCAREGIPYIDVLDPMRRYNAQQPLYFRIDGHMNAEGHRVAAQALYAHFEEVLSRHTAAHARPSLGSVYIDR